MQIALNLNQQEVKMKRYLKRLIFGFVILIFALWIFAPMPASAAYPEKTITIIMPFGAGGTGDIILRVLADIIKDDLGKPVVVVNKPGSGGAVGWTLLQSAKPDGYTIGYASNSLFLQTHRTKGSLNYKNFDPVINLNSTPFAITVNANSPWKTLGDFIAYAKANPGKVRIGNAGSGAIWHLSAAAFADKAGIKVTHVPYKGGSKAAAALLGGHIEATSVATGDMTAILPTGKLRLLGIGSEDRDPFFPDIPTLKESGVDLAMANWRGVVTPKGVDKEKIAVLDAAFAKAVKDQKYIDFMKKQKLLSVFIGHAEFKDIYFKTGETLLTTLKAIGK